MTNLDKIPTQDNYKTTLTNKLSTTGLTIEVKDVPSYTPSTTETFAIINGGKSNAECVIIEDYDATNKTITIKAGGRGQSLKKGVTGTAYEHVSGSSLIISDNFGFWEDIQTAINSKNDSLGNKADVYANATARDLAITSPTNGMQVYLTDTGKFYDYTAGSWVERESGGTFANASETVAGKVEVATTEEVLAGTGTGGTGAKLSISPDNGAITATAQTAGGYIPKTNSSGVVSKELIEGLKGTGATVTSANLDTLTDGSVADDLHTHSALGVITATAGEDIDGSTTPKACFIGGGDVDTTVNIEIDQTSQNSNFNLNSTTNRISQSVYFQKIGIFTELKIRAGKFGTPSNLICDLYLADSNDKPTGSSLANATGSESAGVVTFTFSYAITDQLQKYVLVIKGGATANASNYYSVMYQDSDVYTKGLARTSTDSGTTYGDSIGDIYFEITGYLGLQAGLVYLSSSTYNNVYFDGFVTSNVAFLANAFINPVEATTFSGLISGAVYGISTNGSIATTLGLKRIGFALSATKLHLDDEMEKDIYNSNVTGYGTNGVGFGVSSDGVYYMKTTFTSEPIWGLVLYKKNIDGEYVQLSSWTLSGDSYLIGNFDNGSTIFMLSLTEFVIVPYSGIDSVVSGIGVYINNGVGTLITGATLSTGVSYEFAIDSNFDLYFHSSYGVSTHGAGKFVLSNSKTSGTLTSLTPASNFNGLVFVDKDYIYTKPSSYYEARSKTNGALVSTSVAVASSYGNVSRSFVTNRKIWRSNPTTNIVRQYPI